MYTTENNIDIIPIPFRFVNTFLLNYKSNYILVDTGYPKDCVKLHNKISLITLDPELSNLKAIIITHHHNDHTGAVNYFKKINPNIKIIAHKNCFEKMKTGTNDLNNPYYTCSRALQILTRLMHLLFPKSGYFEPYIKQDNDIVVEDKPIYFDISQLKVVDRTFTESDFTSSSIAIDKDGRKTKENTEIKIFATPGHTDDSIVVMIDKYIIAGDTAAASFNIFGSHFLPVIFNDISNLYESWKKIINEKVNTIIPSHGDPFDKEELANNLNFFDKIYKI